MIQKLTTIAADDTNPYENIALEAYLLSHVESGECILYLWQNRKTVVIGKNQNSWKECRIRELEQDGGYLARRLSGGGAVYHDLGNLNFTFLVNREDYSVEKQTQVILQAVRLSGIEAERTGRNDMVVDGKKFSGNAFYQTGNFCYHHGTILVNVCREDMSNYLNVSKEKLQSKGVDSVKSRVTNLSDYAPEITIQEMQKHLILAFEQVYGMSPHPLPETRLDREEIRRLREQFASWEWKYGRKISFDDRIEKRFSWGMAELQLALEGGCIREARLYSDALDPDFLLCLERELAGKRYLAEILTASLGRIPAASEEQEQMKADIIALVCETI